MGDAYCMGVNKRDAINRVSTGLFFEGTEADAVDEFVFGAGGAEK